jgi:hypothetical protein
MDSPASTLPILPQRENRVEALGFPSFAGGSERKRKPPAFYTSGKQESWCRVAPCDISSPNFSTQRPVKCPASKSVDVSFT